MKTVLISPFSRKMRNGKENPKNFPYWKGVVMLLRNKDIRVIQLGENGEPSIGADEFLCSLKFAEIKKLLSDCDAWASVDNFFNHFATYYKKRGVVVFGRSDPSIFGYEQNINLLKDRTYLRPNQFELWEQDEFNQDVFISADIVVSAIESLL